MIHDHETGGVTSCQVCSRTLQLMWHSPSLCNGQTN